MIEFLKNWVLNIITVAMIMVLLELLTPTGRLRKYVNLISGFILIIAVISPFVQFFSKGMDLKEFQIISSNFIDKKEIEKNSSILKDYQMKQIVEVYRKNLIKRIEDDLKDIDSIADVKADIIINEDYKSSNFGEVKRVYLSIKPNYETANVRAVTKIEKIDITKDSKLGDPKKEINSDLKNKIENKICNLLDIQNNNVVISLLEK